jgi:hypothetical protein
MKTLIAMIAGLALASAALAEVNPTRPMLTGHGNVSVRPAKVIVTNQTAPAAANQDVTLDKITVTGSLMKHPVAKVERKK